MYFVLQVIFDVLMRHPCYNIKMLTIWVYCSVWGGSGARHLDLVSILVIYLVLIGMIISQEADEGAREENVAFRNFGDQD